MGIDLTAALKIKMGIDLTPVLKVKMGIDLTPVLKIKMGIDLTPVLKIAMFRAFLFFFSGAGSLPGHQREVLPCQDEKENSRSGDYKR